MPPQSGHVATSDDEDLGMPCSGRILLPAFFLDKPKAAGRICHRQLWAAWSGAGECSGAHVNTVADFSRPLRDEFLPAPTALTLSVTRACFADEIGIDFPAFGTVVDRVRHGFSSGEEVLGATSAQVTLTPRQAFDGTVVPVELALPSLCRHCGGRGETWSDPCGACCGTGEAERSHNVHLAVPARVIDGTRFRFVVAPPQARPTRVEVTVSIA